MNALRSLVGRLDRFGTHPQRLIGLAVTRIGLGGTFVLMYLNNLPFRDLLWGPHGASDFEQFRNSLHAQGVPSLYALSASTWWFNLVYFTGLLVAGAWTVYGGRPLTLVHAVFVWSLYTRNEELGDGGDNLNRILVIFLVFATTNAWFSPNAKKVRARLAARADRPRPAVSLHNTAALLVVFQTVTVYTVAGLWKVAGSRWREGNALYYVSQVHEYSTTSLLPWLMRDAFLVTAATYLTVAVQLSVPLAVLTRRRWFREAVLLLIAGMHLGIMYGMGLVSFGLFMMAADATLLTDTDYRVTGRKLRDVYRRLRRRDARMPSPDNALGTPVSDQAAPDEAPPASPGSPDEPVAGEKKAPVPVAYGPASVPSPLLPDAVRRSDAAMEGARV